MWYDLLQEGWMALHRAVANGHANVVDALLAAGSAVDATTLVSVIHCTGATILTSDKLALPIKRLKDLPGGSMTC
jgi:ankyrin repeat protein